MVKIIKNDRQRRVMKKTSIIFLTFVMLMSVVMGLDTLGTIKQNECVELKQICADCTYVNFTKVSFPNSTVALGNVLAEKNGANFNYTFCNTTEIGTYSVDGVGDPATVDTVFSYTFDVTYDGSDSPIGINIIIIILFVGLFVGFFFYQKGIDLERWNNKNISKYLNKNYIKLALSSIGYNLIKNSYVIYYVLGFFIMLSLSNMVIGFNILYLIKVTEILMFLYSWGFLIIGIVLFSHVQEWLMDLLDKVSDINFGIER